MTQAVYLSESAAFHVKKMMENNGETDAYLRVSVNGGGCSGLTYGLGFDEEKKDQDELVEQHGLKILVSNTDIPVLKGTEIDYKESLMGGGFTIENPNAIISCGCGTSFRTAENHGAPSTDC